MLPKLPPLNGLRLFATVARCGSFRLAAQELNLTPGAVSHGIKSLNMAKEPRLPALALGAACLTLAA
jgi:hypothetical protein